MTASFIPATGSLNPADVPPLEGYPLPLPDLSLIEFKATTGLGDIFAPERLRMILRQVQIETAHVLQPWLVTRAVGSADRLYDGGDLTAIEADLYKMAVYSHARALLLATTRDYDSTRSGEAKADRLETEIAVYRAQANTALSLLMGRKRTVVELI